MYTIKSIFFFSERAISVLLIIAWLLKSIYENGKCILTSLYRSLSQNQHEFEIFRTMSDFLIDDINNELPIILVITGDRLFVLSQSSL